MMDTRFRSSDELRFVLRSIENHAPWLRRIYLVTNGQVPSWLDLDHPKLVVVPHDQIFERPADLPTFNSHAIEWNLKNIPGLAEHFIYLNDDTFLGHAATVGDFLNENGQVQVFVEPEKTLAVAMSDRSLIGHVWAYNHNLLIDYFGRKHGRRLFAHTTTLYSVKARGNIPALAKRNRVYDRQ
jgi:hypothetical protein